MDSKLHEFLTSSEVTDFIGRAPQALKDKLASAWESEDYAKAVKLVEQAGGPKMRAVVDRTRTKTLGGEVLEAAGEKVTVADRGEVAKGRKSGKRKPGKSPNVGLAESLAMKFGALPPEGTVNDLGLTLLDDAGLPMAATAGTSAPVEPEAAAEPTVEGKPGKPVGKLGRAYQALKGRKIAGFPLRHPIITGLGATLLAGKFGNNPIPEQAGGAYSAEERLQDLEYRDVLSRRKENMLRRDPTLAQAMMSLLSGQPPQQERLAANEVQIGGNPRNPNVPDDMMISLVDLLSSNLM